MMEVEGGWKGKKKADRQVGRPRSHNRQHHLLPTTVCTTDPRKSKTSSSAWVFFRTPYLRGPIPNRQLDSDTRCGCKRMTGAILKSYNPTIQVLNLTKPPRGVRMYIIEKSVACGFRLTCWHARADGPFRARRLVRMSLGHGLRDETRLIEEGTRVGTDVP
ncbi:hypothetical protein P170DRAFT_209008 [Aspergillus steynii IBT 23096]|uniref:Uncharacterized protein n=1 Tax=Aspergillus steynii IBT 23096 TaxID=1392250 RepID=A0A2I2G5V2_9EURO|nr:uncharacterized protein P170DRAFT_209008 [Aspergillus steynii IBT 23096]PLB48250.1 hypothetical protein P170DRAFT_209008 [Aspergillus steynii IBT 23096]